MVRRHYFDLACNGRDWPTLVQAHRDRVLEAADPSSFELAVHVLLRELGTSHTGFFHQTLRRVPGRLALGASLRVERTHGEARWVCQTVNLGGPAALAGLQSPDALMAVNGKRVVPPEQPMGPMGSETRLLLRRSNGQDEEVRMAMPRPRWKHQPFAEPEPVTAQALDGSVGYLRAVLFPGLVGVDVARQIDR